MVTHRNSYLEREDVRAYADNQIGYRRQSAGLRRFFIESRYNPFRHLPDGIHEVSKLDYLDFNREHQIRIDSFESKGTILMLKREGVYLFLFRWSHTNQLYLLSGAKTQYRADAS